MADLPSDPPSVLVRERSGPARCAVCHDELAPEVRALTCFSCGSAAHEECRAELDGCPTLACADRPAGVRLQRDGPVQVVVRPRQVDGGWFPVPSLGEALIVLALMATLLITAVTAFRDPLNNTFNGPTRKLMPGGGITVPIGG